MGSDACALSRGPAGHALDGVPADPQLCGTSSGLSPAGCFRSSSGRSRSRIPPWRSASDPRGSLGVCPYKGLAFFDRADADYFFGRERLVTDLIARLGQLTVVGILGPSGIGKSSPPRAAYCQR